jgi:hypothetical protein
MTDHFQIIDGAIGPAPWMQWRQVASESTEAVSKRYSPTDGTAKNDLVQTLQTHWTNNSPIGQWVYGKVTSAGNQVTLQCRSRAFLSTAHGYEMSEDGEDIPMVEVSRFGIGGDLGNGGLLGLGGAFGIAGYREHSSTIALMPHLTGWFYVPPESKFHARVEVRFISEAWENTMIDGGDSDTEAKFIAGDLRVDLFAVPALVPPKPRLTPFIVGGADNIQHDREINLGPIDAYTEVNVPDGVEEGDVLLAIVANDQGFASEIFPHEDGWYMLHSRGDGFFNALASVHMRIWYRNATDDEPDTYTFNNALLSEETAVIIAIRDAQPLQLDNINWYVGSNYMRWGPDPEQIAPSLNLGGQLLLLVSFLNHHPNQTPVVQEEPEGTTLLKNLSGLKTTMAIAQLVDPPSPTLDRKFTPDKDPFLSGHTIAASILIPGLQET